MARLDTYFYPRITFCDFVYFNNVIETFLNYKKSKLIKTCNLYVALGRKNVDIV